VYRSPIGFVSGAIPSTYREDFDYHLVDSLGLQGSGIGIYTSGYNGNDNRRPAIPVIVSDTIETGTNSLGRLPVKIKAVSKSAN